MVGTAGTKELKTNYPERDTESVSLEAEESKVLDKDKVGIR